MEWWKTRIVLCVSVGGESGCCIYLTCVTCGAFEWIRNKIQKKIWIFKIWQIFKNAFHKAQDLPVPRCKKSGNEGKRQAWLSGDLLVKLKGKRELHRQWKQGQVSWESIGILPVCVGIRSGGPRHDWS